MLSLSTTLFALKNWQNHRIPKKKVESAKAWQWHIKRHSVETFFFALTYQSISPYIYIYIYIYTHTQNEEM
jgi:L-lactate permease